MFFIQKPARDVSKAPGNTRADHGQGKLSGKSSLSENERMGALVSQAAYGDEENRVANASLTSAGFHYNIKASDNSTAVYDRGTERFIGIRGTSSLGDVLTDTAIVTTGIKSTQRFKTDYQHIRKLVEEQVRNGGTTQLVGHSLGGTLTSELVQQLVKDNPALKGKVRGTAYNEGAAPNRDDTCTGPVCDAVTHIRTKGDVISASTRNKTKVVRGKCAGNATDHGISQFTGEGDCAQEGNVLTKISRTAENVVSATLGVGVKAYTAVKDVKTAVGGVKDTVGGVTAVAAAFGGGATVGGAVGAVLGAKAAVGGVKAVVGVVKKYHSPANRLQKFSNTNYLRPHSRQRIRA
jgi:hypothetical protein